MTTTRTFPPARAILWEYLARYPLLDFGIVAGFAVMVAPVGSILEGARIAPPAHRGACGQMRHTSYGAQSPRGPKPIDRRRGVGLVAIKHRFF